MFGMCQDVALRRKVSISFLSQSSKIDGAESGKPRNEDRCQPSPQKTAREGSTSPRSYPSPFPRQCEKRVYAMAQDNAHVGVAPDGSKKRDEDSEEGVEFSPFWVGGPSIFAVLLQSPTS
jgi:hypothetical protein